MSKHKNFRFFLLSFCLFFVQTNKPSLLVCRRQFFLQTNQKVQLQVQKQSNNYGQAQHYLNRKKAFFCNWKSIYRVQSFTLHQDINSVSSFNRCLNVTFVKTLVHITLGNPNEKSNKHKSSLMNLLTKANKRSSSFKKMIH